jgi:hypothetical protein
MEGRDTNSAEKVILQVELSNTWAFRLQDFKDLNLSELCSLVSAV